MFALSSRPAAAARRGRHRAAARLQEHLQPRAAAGRPGRGRDRSCTTCWTATTRASCSTRCVRWAAGSSATAPCCTCAAWAAGCGAAGRALPRQRRHRDAPADRRAGGAGRPRRAALQLRGVPRMHERPIGDLVDALRPLGCGVDDLGQPGYPPLRVRGQAGGRLATRSPIRVRGDVSSQFLTALLLALPLVAAHGAGGDRGRRRADLQALHRDHAEAAGALRHHWCSATAGSASPSRRQRLPHAGRDPCRGDASSASYFVALGAIAATADAPVRIEGVGSDSIQGDIRFVEAAQAMGAQVQRARAGSR
jgi:hypothetical protein